MNEPMTDERLEEIASGDIKTEPNIEESVWMAGEILRLREERRLRVKESVEARVADARYDRALRILKARREAGGE